MKVLAIADVEEKCLWDFYRKDLFDDVDLILSAGDLDPDYLEFLVTVTNKPLLYVRGNHDDRYAHRAPGGCICLEDSVYVYEGIRIVGLGGSMRYRGGLNMYNEREMAKRVRKLERAVRMPHQGFACFNGLIERWKPDYMVHGHIHKGYIHDFKRVRTMPCGTQVINAYGYTVFDIDESKYDTQGWKASLLNSQTMRRELKRHSSEDLIPTHLSR